MSWVIYLLGALASFVLALLSPWMWLSALAVLAALLLLFASAFSLLASRVGGTARSELDALGPEELRRLRDRLGRPASTESDGGSEPSQV